MNLGLVFPSSKTNVTYTKHTSKSKEHCLEHLLGKALYPHLFP